LTPAQAGQLELGEPDWTQRYAEHLRIWRELPRYQQQENAYEATLRDWRRFHAAPIKGSDKRQPAPAVDGIIALANLKVYAPRSTPRDGVIGYQHDDHCWLSIAGEQWRITAIEDRQLLLERMDEAQKQIDLNRADWGAYNAAAATVLEAFYYRLKTIRETMTGEE
jgi:hypothetical protein